MNRTSIATMVLLSTLIPAATLVGQAIPKPYKCPVVPIIEVDGKVIGEGFVQGVNRINQLIGHLDLTLKMSFFTLGLILEILVIRATGVTAGAIRLQVEENTHSWVCTTK